ncbi:CopG family transcriptional regulator [Streptomyces sp. DSM 44917]|uniref:CopG family transcriptional regulator n=1 Tax=Streptomyces boetiae TaxID=3075541 RepID=A0ABU2LAW4_9ACTN|nr:CopG family transcriptional regulator [Streptomyces sp. DSM 44917]MDT0308652.1 CopG family transcriptional regulator [Streptomyces sp. DSM 44917]
MATKKITVTIPEDLLEEIRGEAAERGLSAYVAEALRMKHEQDRLAEVAAWLEEEYGPFTEEELAAARAELDAIDAEHARRRADADPEAAREAVADERAGGQAA